MALQSLPLELRTAAALRLIQNGEDPLVMLSVAVWPDSAPVFEDVPTIEIVEFCPKGHQRTPETTYVRKNGWRYCRVCAKEWKGSNRRSLRSYRKKKVPCTYCGEPACSTHDNKGNPIPRCRRCFLKHLKESKRAAA